MLRTMLVECATKRQRVMWCVGFLATIGMASKEIAQFRTHDATKELAYVSTQIQAKFHMSFVFYKIIASSPDRTSNRTSTRAHQTNAQFRDHLPMGRVWIMHSHQAKKTLIWPFWPDVSTWFILVPSEGGREIAQLFGRHMARWRWCCVMLLTRNLTRKSHLSASWWKSQHDRIIIICRKSQHDMHVYEPDRVIGACRARDQCMMMMMVQRIMSVFVKPILQLFYTFAHWKRPFDTIIFKNRFAWVFMTKWKPKSKSKNWQMNSIDLNGYVH